MRNLHYLAGMLILYPCLLLADNPSQDFSEFGFDELMQMEITSVSKKSEKLSKEDEIIINLRNGRQMPVKKQRIIWQDGRKEKQGKLKNARQMTSTEGA